MAKWFRMFTFQPWELGVEAERIYVKYSALVLNSHVPWLHWVSQRFNPGLSQCLGRCLIIWISEFILCAAFVVTKDRSLVLPENGVYGEVKKKNKLDPCSCHQSLKKRGHPLSHPEDDCSVVETIYFFFFLISNLYSNLTKS